MKVKFYLANPAAEVSSITASFHWDGLRDKKAAGVSIETRNWNKERRVITPREIGAAKKNYTLKSIRSWAEDWYYKSDELTKKNFSAAWAKSPWSRKEPEAILPENDLSFFDQFESWIEDSRTKITPRGTLLSAAALKNYDNCMKALKKFQERTNYVLTFARMDFQFEAKFRTFCVKQLNHRPNTYGKYIDVLRQFLKDCVKNDIEVNPKFQYFESPRIYKGVDYLSIEQLRAIKNIDMQEIHAPGFSLAMKDSIRDIFLFQCYTSLRISDVFRIKKSYIQGDRILMKSTQKTGAEVGIPYIESHELNPVEIVRRRMDKFSDYVFTWNGNPYPAIKTVTNAMNQVLPKIGDKIKCPFRITTKIGRKTFVTYTVRVLKMTKAEVMQITGHTTERNFNRYLGFDFDKVMESYRNAAKIMKVG